MDGVRWAEAYSGERQSGHVTPVFFIHRPVDMHFVFFALFTSLHSAPPLQHLQQQTRSERGRRPSGPAGGPSCRASAAQKRTYAEAFSTLAAVVSLTIVSSKWSQLVVGCSNRGRCSVRSDGCRGAPLHHVGRIFVCIEARSSRQLTQIKALDGKRTRAGKPCARCHTQI